MIENFFLRKRNLKAPEVFTLSRKTQVIYNWCGAYDFVNDAIYLGCDEKHTPTIIWHEIIHKYLFENIDFETCMAWENIADELQKYLFNLDVQNQPYVFSRPPPRAIEQDGGKWRNGIKKIKKSKKTGWKKSTTKKIPVRKHEDIINNALKK